MNAQEKKVVNDIEVNGCHILHVMEDEGEPCFSYSIGINKKQNHADVVVLGLQRDTTHYLINDYKNRLQAGECFEPGHYYSDFIDGFDVCFVEVDKQYFENYFGWGIWLHKGNDFRMLQMVWPNSEGAWPWDPESIEQFRSTQPVLNKAVEITSV